VERDGVFTYSLGCACLGWYTVPVCDNGWSTTNHIGQVGKFDMEGERVMEVMMRLAGPYLHSLDVSGFHYHQEEPCPAPRMTMMLPMYGASYAFFGSDTRLTTIKLWACGGTNCVPKSLGDIIQHSPHLRRLDLRGVQAADYLLSFDLATCCPKLASYLLSFHLYVNCSFMCMSV
jgi:hypothetical protein